MQISHATARANAGAWWPCWPSMVGHESRRPAAKPRLGSGVPHASVSAGVEFACPWPASTRAATVPPVRTPWLGLGQALTPNQISDAAVRANAGAWLGPGTHPSGLGVPNAHNGPCPKPAACPTRRRTAGPARPHHLRSARNATCEPGVVGRCGATQRRARVVSASTTRAIRPALSRPRTLRGSAQQCQLDRTACNRYGMQRVGRAVRDGAGRLCWAIACGGGPPPKASNSCTGCTRAWSCDATHGTVARAGWSRRAAGATLHRP